MPAPVCECPKPFTGKKLFFIVRNANELAVSCAALDTNPVKIGRDICLGDGIVDFQRPVEALTCAVVTVECSCPRSLEVGVLRLPCWVFGIDRRGRGTGIRTNVDVSGPFAWAKMTVNFLTVR